ncbi:MAG: acetyltransferase [Balneolaceae bacterium]|nr:acetyltransferase [Balneolaceae bacterium]
MNENEKYQLAEKVKEACIQAAREGFQNASISGLCKEGSVEAAISAIQNLKVEKFIEK